MTKRQQTILGVSAVILAAIAGGFWSQWRHVSGQTMCPNCAAHGRYETTIDNGEELLSCHNCRSLFIAEVKDGRLTGRNKTAEIPKDTLQGRLDAALDINQLHDRDMALKKIAIDAAAAGEAELVKRAVAEIKHLPYRDEAGRDAAFRLAKAGKGTAATEVAKLIPHEPTREETLKRLAKGND